MALFSCSSKRRKTPECCKIESDYQLVYTTMTETDVNLADFCITNLGKHRLFAISCQIAAYFW